MFNELKPFEGSKQKRKRLGRGMSSGTGKTCGRGVKGQKSRSGVAIKGFEGGQMPIYRRLPKRGFVSRKDRDIISIINLGTLQLLIDAKKIDASKPIDINILKSHSMVPIKAEILRVLGAGELKEKITLKADYISKAAKEKLEKSGSKFDLIAPAA